MNLQEIANLITVRNHLDLLINTDRAAVTKDKVKEANARKADFDKRIVEEALNLDLNVQEKVIINDNGTKFTVNADAISFSEVLSQDQTNTDKPWSAEQGVIETFQEDETPKEPEKPIKAAKNKEQDTDLDEDIRARISQAKKEVSGKKTSAAQSFKRADADD